MKGSLSLKEQIYKYLPHLPVILLIIGSCLLVSWIKIRYADKIYTTSITILVKNEDRKNAANYNDVKLDDIGNGLASRRINVANEIELMKSPELMQKVVAAIQANEYYYGTGKVKSTEVPKELFPVKITVLSVTDSAVEKKLIFERAANHVTVSYGKLKQRINNGQYVTLSCGSFRFEYNLALLADGVVYSFVWRPLPSVAAELAGSLDIRQPVREASLLQISMNGYNSNRSEAVLNQFVKQYNNSSISDQNKVLENTIAFIDDRLNLLSVELRELENSLLKFAEQSGDLDFENQKKISSQKKEEFEKQLEGIYLDSEIVEMLRSYVSDTEKTFDLLPSNFTLEDITLVDLLKRYNALQLQRSEDIKRMPEKNHFIKQQSIELSQIRNQIKKSLSNLDVSLKNKRHNIENAFYEQRNILSGLPKQNLEFTAIKRQLTIKENLYTYLLQKREEYVLLKASAIASVKALSSATTSGTPIFPDKKSAYKFALTIGVLLSGVYIYLREILNDRVSNRGDIIARNVPIVGEIFHNNQSPRKSLIVSNERDILSEQLRIVRSNINAIGSNNKCITVLITSSGEKEGKTFLSINLSMLISLGGKKTLLIETDLRRPKFAKYLNKGFKKGIADYLNGEVSIHEVITRYAVNSNLYFLPCGTVPLNAGDLLASPAMKLLIDYAKDNFEYIIFDTAPIGLVSDAAALAKFADVSLYVVRHRKTILKNLDIADKLYRDNKFPNLSFLVNDIRVSGVNSYYGQTGISHPGSYTYSYNYGYGNSGSIIKKIRAQLPF